MPEDQLTPWVSPIVAVPKKDGGVRICVDMRLANEAIKSPDPYHRGHQLRVNGVKQTQLQGQKGVKNIEDDIIVHGKTREEHDVNLDKCLQRLSNKGLRLNQSKCSLLPNTLDFLVKYFQKKELNQIQNASKICKMHQYQQAYTRCEAFSERRTLAVSTDC